MQIKNNRIVTVVATLIILVISFSLPHPLLFPLVIPACQVPHGGSSYPDIQQPPACQ